jgi:hypothetical protein
MSARFLAGRLGWNYGVPSITLGAVQRSGTGEFAFSSGVFHRFWLRISILDANICSASRNFGRSKRKAGMTY